MHVSDSVIFAQGHRRYTLRVARHWPSHVSCTWYQSSWSIWMRSFDIYGQWLVPTNIDTHTHAQSSHTSVGSPQLIMGCCTNMINKPVYMPMSTRYIICSWIMKSIESSLPNASPLYFCNLNLWTAKHVIVYLDSHVIMDKAFIFAYISDQNLDGGKTWEQG